MEPEAWKSAAQKSRDFLKASVPTQYLVEESKLPAASALNVTKFPAESGMLSQKELDITEMGATELVEKMRADHLTAEEVVIAFLKRAVLGHQLVSIPKAPML